MAKKSYQKSPLFSYEVKVYQDRIEVSFFNWEKATPVMIQRTYDHIQTKWGRMQEAAVRERQKKEREMAQKTNEEDTNDAA